MITNLAQSELDDAYHLAYFECEAAAIDVIRSTLDDERVAKLRDLMLDRMSNALHKVEMVHLGPERYAALVQRLSVKVIDHEGLSQ